VRNRERENKGGRGGAGERERDRTHANTGSRPKNRGTQLYTCTHTIRVSASKEHRRTQDKPLSYACCRRAFRGAHSRQANAEGLQKLTGSHVGIAGGLVGAGGELQGLSSLDVCIARGRVLVRIILRGERWGGPGVRRRQRRQRRHARVQRSHHALRTMETRHPHPAPVATAETTANGEHRLVEHQPRPPPPPRLSPQQTCSLRAVQRARAPLTGAPYFQARSASGRQPAVPCTMLARAGTVPPSLLPPARRSPAARGTARAARGSPSGAR